jgi:myosin V
VKRTHTANPRAVSVAYNGEEGIPRFRGANGLSDIYDDLAEEKIRLLQDVRNLDEDILEGLIKGLKIPLPSFNKSISRQGDLVPRESHQPGHKRDVEVVLYSRVSGS